LIKKTVEDRMKQLEEFRAIIDLHFNMSEQVLSFYRESFREKMDYKTRISTLKQRTLQAIGGSGTDCTFCGKLIIPGEFKYECHWLVTHKPVMLSI